VLVLVAAMDVAPIPVLVLVAAMDVAPIPDFDLPCANKRPLLFSCQ